MGSEKKNFTKAKVLLFLSKIEQHDLDDPWQALPDIAAAIGASTGSLNVLARRWAVWRYIKLVSFTAAQMQDGHSHSFIRLDSRGKQYLATMPTWFKRYGEAEAEVDRALAEERREALRPRAVVWGVRVQLPGEVKLLGYICISWPFATGGDAYRVFGGAGRHNFLVDGLGSAFSVVRQVFGIEPGERCIAAAKFYQGELVAEFTRDMAAVGNGERQRA